MQQDDSMTALMTSKDGGRYQRISPAADAAVARDME